MMRARTYLSGAPHEQAGLSPITTPYSLIVICLNVTVRWHDSEWRFLLQAGISSGRGDLNSECFFEAFRLSLSVLMRIIPLMQLSCSF